MEGDSLFQRLRRGLTKTREGWVQRLEALFHGRQWDEEALACMEEILLSADVGVKATEKLIEAMRRQSLERQGGTAQDLSSCLQQEIITMLEGAKKNAAPPLSSPPPRVILFLGVNGVGKTTTIGKLAARYRRDGKKVLVVAADTFRAAATEQLEVWAQRVGAEIVKHQPGADPSAVVFDGLHAAKKRDADLVLIDTAGRLHTKIHLIEELKKIRRVTAREQAGAPHETLLILDATTGQNAFQQARVFKESLEITGIALTKLDGTAKGGVVIGIQNELGIPVRYIGVGEEVDDLQPFDATLFVRSLFGDS
jgi:fused signal recognition particle receptor